MCFCLWLVSFFVKIQWNNHTEYVKIQWNNHTEYVKIPMEFIACMWFSMLNRNREIRRWSYKPKPSNPTMRRKINILSLLSIFSFCCHFVVRRGGCFFSPPLHSTPYTLHFSLSVYQFMSLLVYGWIGLLVYTPRLYTLHQKIALRGDFLLFLWKNLYSSKKCTTFAPCKI